MGRFIAWRALRRLNRVRTHHLGLEPVPELPKGVPSRSDSCVLAAALPRCYVTGKGIEDKENGRVYAHSIFSAMFICLFDMGRYPQLIRSSWREPVYGRHAMPWPIAWPVAICAGLLGVLFSGVVVAFERLEEARVRKYQRKQAAALIRAEVASYLEAEAAKRRRIEAQKKRELEHEMVHEPTPFIPRVVSKGHEKVRI